MENSSKLSYFHCVGEEPLLGITLGNLLETAACKFEEEMAVISCEQEQRLTYKELLEAADTFAAGLSVLNLVKGDRIGIWATNVIEWYVVYMAIARAGFCLVALNPQYQPAELEYCINKVGVKVLVCLHKSKHQHFYDVLTEIAPELKISKTKILNNEKVPSLMSVIVIGPDNLNGTYNYNDVLKLATHEDIIKIKSEQNLIQPDKPLCIMYSSGTTGEPKAAVLSHFQMVNSAFCFGKRTELHEKHHRICLQVPFFHVYGAVIAIIGAMHFGSTLVIASTTYSPVDTIKCLKKNRCSVMYGTPTMYVDLINLQIQLNESICLEIAVTGAASCSPELYRQIRTVLRVSRIKTIYGMTECSGATFQSSPIEESESVVTSTIGHVGDHLEVKIIDKNGIIVPMGMSGELCVRGYCTMLGYWEDDKRTKEAMRSDKWLHTGDQVSLQEDGYGRIVGRLTDMIIRGGENIFPKEVEDVLSTHPAILESQVIGLPHLRLGQEVCACVKLRIGYKLTLESLTSYLRGKMAFAKIPSQLKILDEFPKTASGKIQKHKLSYMFSNGNTK